MKVLIVVLSAIAFARGSGAGFPSSFTSVSGSQYHPQEWNSQSDRSYYGGSSSSSIYGNSHKNVYPEHIPVIHDGVPVETPEVQAAKAHFYEEYARAAALAAKKPDPLDGQYADEYSKSKYTSVNNGWTGTQNRLTQEPQIWESNNDYNTNTLYNHNSFVPVETPEVQHAKAAHFQAYAAALSRSSGHKQHHRYRRSATEWAQPKYQGPIHIPHITAQGVPVDTPEVQHAKSLHHQALNEATARAHASGYVPETEWKNDDVSSHEAYGPPQAAAWPSTPINTSYKIHHVETPKWHGPEHIPVLDHNGVPIDTPEVQHARKAHLSALAAESLKHQGWEGVQQKW